MSFVLFCKSMINPVTPMSPLATETAQQRSQYAVAAIILPT